MKLTYQKKKKPSLLQHFFFCIDFVPNTSDDEGRYSIGAQANVGLFNLQKLLEALKPLLTSDQLSQ